MIHKEDKGFCEALISILNGKESLETRVNKAEKIFFLLVKVPPQHKEEIIILWLTDILSGDKVNECSEAEVVLCWKTLHRLFTSKRLQSLFSQHWVCLLNSEFFEKLVSIASESSLLPEIKEDVALIWKWLIDNPLFSPNIVILLNHPHVFCALLLSWMSESNNPCLPFASLLIKLLRKSQFILMQPGILTNSFSFIYDKILFPSLQIMQAFQSSTESEVNEFLVELKMFLNNTVFSIDSVKYHEKVFELLLLKDSTSHTDTDKSLTFYQFLMRIINSSEVFSVFALTKYTDWFIKSYKKMTALCFEYFVVVLYFLGVDMNAKPNILHRNVAMLALPISKEKTQMKDIGPIVQVLRSSDINFEKWSFDEAHFSDWLSALFDYMLSKIVEVPEFALGGLFHLLEIFPTIVVEKDSLITSLMSVGEVSYSLLPKIDRVLCKILDAYIKGRLVHKLLKLVSLSLLHLDGEFQLTYTYGTDENWLIHKSCRILPQRFLRKLLATIREMGTQMSFHVCSVMQNILHIECHKILQEEDDAAKFRMVALVVWLMSCCLNMLPMLQVTYTSGMTTNGVKAMNSLAEICVLLTNDSLGLKKAGSDVCGALLNMASVWAEHHFTLSSSDSRYKESSKFVSQESVHSVGVKDFSVQVPFLPTERWAEIMERLNEKEDSMRCFVVQLIIQKISLIVAERTRNILDPTVDLVPKSDLLEKCLDYIFEEVDTVNYVSTTDVVALHLPSLIPFMKKKHCESAARMFVSGMSEGQEVWIKFGQSHYFQGHEQLRIFAFINLCYKLLNLLGEKKREVDHDILEDINKSTKRKFDSHKVIASLIKVSEHNERAKMKEELSNAFSLMNSLLDSNQNYNRLKNCNEEELLKILMVLELFPFSIARPTLTLAAFIFISILFMEEGGLEGRETIVRSCLRLMCFIVSTSHAPWIFSLVQSKCWSLLSFWVRKSQSLFNGVDVAEISQKIILGPDEIEHNFLTEDSVMANLIYLLNSLTKIFVQWNVRANYILDYCRETFNERKENNSNAFILSSLMVALQAKGIAERGDIEFSCNLLKALKVLHEWALFPFVNENSVTKFQQTNFFSILTVLLLISKRIKEAGSEKQSPIGPQTKRLKTTKISMAQNDEIDVVVNKIFSNIDWNNVTAKCFQLGNTTSISQNSHIRKICFDFLIEASIPLVSVNPFRTNWKIFQLYWNLVPVNDDVSCRKMETCLKYLTIKQYKVLLSTLLEKTRTSELEEITLTQLRIVLGVECEAFKFQRQDFAEELIPVLCMRITPQNKKQISGHTLDRLLNVLILILKNLKITENMKTPVLGVCSTLSTYSFPDISEFVKVFDGVSRILVVFLLTGSRFVGAMCAPIMSIIRELLLSLMKHANDNQNLNEELCKGLEKSSNSLETITKDLRKYYVEFCKVVPLSFKEIINGIQYYYLTPLLRDSIIRTVCNLLNVSDEDVLNYLWVTLLPTESSFLKDLKSSFTGSIDFKPK